MSEKSNKNFRKELKAVQSSAKENYYKEVDKKVKDTYTDIDEKVKDLKDIKKLKWIDYIVAILVSALIIGISFLIGIYGLKTIKKVDWVIVGFIFLMLVCWLVIGWIKNNNAAKFFNDKRRRYQPTLTDEEATLKKYRKITMLIAILLLIGWLIVFLTIK